MLQPINHVLTHPDDIPSMPRAAKEYLQVRFNQAYVMESGEYRALRSAGYSESFIAGVIHGLYLASRTLDEIEVRKEQLRQE